MEFKLVFRKKGLLWTSIGKLLPNYNQVALPAKTIFCFKLPLFEDPTKYTTWVYIQISWHLIISHMPIPIMDYWDPVSSMSVWFLATSLWTIPCIHFDFLWVTPTFCTALVPHGISRGFGFGRPLVRDFFSHLFAILWYFPILGINVINWLRSCTVDICRSHTSVQNKQ